MVHSWKLSMKSGDLVVPWQTCMVHAHVDVENLINGPRFREWKTDQPAIIVNSRHVHVRGIDVLRFQILLGGEFWWAVAVAAHILEPNETR